MRRFVVTVRLGIVAPALLAILIGTLAEGAAASPGLPPGASAVRLADSDGDGIPDELDPDDDNDGVADGAAAQPSRPDSADQDGDGDAIPDSHDPDDNNNGVTDDDEWSNPPPDTDTGGGSGSNGDPPVNSDATVGDSPAVASSDAPVLVTALPVTGSGHPASNARPHATICALLALVALACFLGKTRPRARSAPAIARVSRLG